MKLNRSRTLGTYLVFEDWIVIALIEVAMIIFHTGLEMSWHCLKSQFRAVLIKFIGNIFQEYHFIWVMRWAISFH